MQFFFQFYLSPHLTDPESWARVGAKAEKFCGVSLPPINQWHFVMSEKPKWCRCSASGSLVLADFALACNPAIHTKLQIIKESSSMFVGCHKLKCITQSNCKWLWPKMEPCRSINKGEESHVLIKSYDKCVKSSRDCLSVHVPRIKSSGERTHRRFYWTTNTFCPDLTCPPSLLPFSFFSAVGGNKSRRGQTTIK